MRPFRFGVLTRAAESAAAWTGKARRLEDAGFSTLLISDHFAGERLAPMPALTAAAGATTRLRVGTLVLGNDFRHPAVVAKEATTVDFLSEGRMELGIGAGWIAADYETTGQTFDAAGVRIDRLAESLAVIKDLWSDGPADHRGMHYRVEGLQQRPCPVQRPHPPILVGGAGPRILRLAAAEADIVHVLCRFAPGGFFAADADSAVYARKVAAIRESPRYDDLELATNVLEVGRPRPSIWTEGRGPDDSPQVLPADSAEAIDRLQRHREELGISYFILHSEEDVEAFAPVVAALADA